MTTTRSAAILTERLSLTPPRLEDFDAYADMLARSTLGDGPGSGPFTRGEAWVKFVRGAGFWPLLGTGAFTIRERDGGRYVGDVMAADFRRDIEPATPPGLELGWVLAPEARGCGYATEAVGAVLDWAAATLAPARFLCIISPSNAPSARVARKCGFERIGAARAAGALVDVFERDAKA